MKNKKILTIVIIVLTMLLSSCAGKEPNDIAYVVALGIDSADNNNLKITIQYANTTHISGGSEGGKAGSEIVDNIVLEAPNIYGAIGVANSIVSKTFSLSHAKLIVFSEEVAKKGIGDIVGSISRSEEVRPDVFLAVTQGEASKYLNSVTPEMEVNPAQYYQTIYAQHNVGGVEMGQEKDFFFSIETKDYDSVLPIAGESESGGAGESGGSGGESESKGSSGNSGGENESSGEGSSEGSGDSKSQENIKQKDAAINDKLFDYKMKNYTGGETAIQKKNKSEVAGLAVFKEDKMVCTIGSVEDKMFKIIYGNSDYNFITYFSRQSPEKPVTVRAVQEKIPKYDIDLENKKVNIELFIESDLYCMPAHYNIESNLEEFEKTVEEDMNKTFTQFMNDFLHKYDCDIFRLKERSKNKFLTIGEYEEFKKTVDFREFEFNVKTNFKIRRTGLIMKEQ